MLHEKSFIGKYYLFFIYLLLLLVDCWYLYTGKYSYRIYSKTILMPFLVLFFINNSSFNITSTPATLTGRILLYIAFVLAWASDICGTIQSTLLYKIALLLYPLVYLLYAIILLQVQRASSREKKIFIYVKKALPTFLILLLIAMVYLNKIVGFGTEFYQLCIYANTIILLLAGAFTANLWGEVALEKLRLIFGIGVFLLIASNMIYGIDELRYHRTLSILDVLVALSNGFSQFFIVLGMIKWLNPKKKKSIAE
ncbi:hypothetical protein [Parasediminibacterium sp. JCM 36343]|uniref:hypothetical protein n=1 Tax=Parasediminibacterium sp. JCM 36343 TaxID=3374279 RepID=UPI00397B61B3